MAASVNPNSNPYAGGGKFVAGVPTSGPTGSIAPASNGGSLIGGVQGSTPMLARNSRGTNISIPYARVVLHPSGRTALPAPQNLQDPSQLTLGKPGGDIIVETEFLYSGRIGFILGRRGKKYQEAGIDKLLGMEAMESNLTVINSRTANRLQMFATGGVDQHTMQRMCSLEYLQRYFYHVLRKKTIDLSTQLFPNASDVPIKYRAVSTQLRAADQTLNNVDGDALITGIGTAAKATLPDLAVRAKVEKSGIFAGDDGPFLRGKTIDSSLSAYKKNYQKGSMGIGDRVAFEQLEFMLRNIGAMDWMPDGIVLSKLDSGGNDRLADDDIDARDGQLYNITIGGPAITSSWTGDPKLEVLPLDKLYIVLVGDVWTGLDAAGLQAVWDEDDAFLTSPKVPLAPGVFPRSYKTQFETHIDKDDDRDPKDKTKGTRFNSFATPPTSAQGQTITNIRVERMTSSQMVSYSEYVPGNTTKSRLGLKIGKKGGEYILGGWCIGTVIDSAASRAIPNGMSLVGAVKRSRSAHAANLLVDIKWHSGDDLYKRYMNTPSLGTAKEQTSGLLRSRYDMRIRPRDPFNAPATSR